jgi:hypothetical protein
MFKFICVILSNAIHNIFESAINKVSWTRGLGLPETPSGVQGQSPVGGFGGLSPPISDFEQLRVYLGQVLLQNSHKNMSQLYTIVHS